MDPADPAADPVPPPRRRSVPTAYLIAGAVAVVVATGFLVWRTGKLQKWFARDTENPAAMNRLRDDPPDLRPPADPAAGWPQWLGPYRDGRAPAGPLRTNWDAKPLVQVWAYPCGGGYSSFAVVGGKLYSQDRPDGHTERVFCLDAATGDKLWEHRYPADYAGVAYADGPRATPTVEGNRVYTVRADGLFLCLEAPADTGGSPKVLWQHDLPAEFRAKKPSWGYAGSPLIDGDQVIVIPGGRDGGVASFDKLTGVRKWAFGSNPAGYSSPVVAQVPIMGPMTGTGAANGARVILALTGDALLCLGTDGALEGSYGWDTDHHGNIATPLVLGDYVFISSGYGQGCALLRIDPAGAGGVLELVYARRNKPLRAHHSTPVAFGKYLYGFDGDAGGARLRCLNYIDGLAVEGWDGEGVKNGKIVLAGKYLVILSQTGELSLVEATPDEFRLLAAHATGFVGNDNWSLPVLVDGRLYLRGKEPDGYAVVCLDVR